MLNYKDKIRMLREKENITQKMMADALGISRSAYDHFEQQYDVIPIKRLNQVANYFNVSIDFLFGFTDKWQYKNSKKDIDIIKSSIRLKEFRKDNKLTQEKLGIIINTSPSVILHHEHQRVILGTQYLYDLCKKFSISADYLLGKTDTPKTYKS